MAWPVTDFDNVRFNQGSGYAEVVAIHLAIKQRADATAHSLADSAPFDDVYDGTSIWLGDPDGDTGRRYLKDQLQDYYDAVSSLIDGDSGIRWTEGSGDTTEWTLASITTDIGLGDWADLLTRAQNHLPFRWLHEALDRLIYTKVTVSVTDASATYTATITDANGTRQEAWDGRATNPTSDSNNEGIVLHWLLYQVFGLGIVVRIRKNVQNAEFVTSQYDGVLAEAYYRYSWIWGANFTGSSISVTIGTETIIGTGTEIGAKVATTDFSISADTYIDADIDTTEPSTVPFSSNSLTVEGMQFGCLSADLHIDLATVLDDQS